MQGTREARELSMRQRETKKFVEYDLFVQSKKISFEEIKIKLKNEKCELYKKKSSNHKLKFSKKGEWSIKNCERKGDMIRKNSNV